MITVTNYFTALILVERDTLWCNKYIGYMVSKMMSSGEKKKKQKQQQLKLPHIRGAWCCSDMIIHLYTSTLVLEITKIKQISWHRFHVIN